MVAHFPVSAVSVRALWKTVTCRKHISVCILQISLTNPINHSTLLALKICCWLKRKRKTLRWKYENNWGRKKKICLENKLNIKLLPLCERPFSDSWVCVNLNQDVKDNIFSSLMISLCQALTISPFQRCFLAFGMDSVLKGGVRANTNHLACATCFWGCTTEHMT